MELFTKYMLPLEGEMKDLLHYVTKEKIFCKNNGGFVYFITLRIISQFKHRYIVHADFLDFPVFLCVQLSTSILISPPLASAKSILLFFHDQLKVQFECLLVSWPLLYQNKIRQQISNPTENIV